MQIENLPDVTDDFFAFLDNERDNPESSFCVVIDGRSSTDKMRDAARISYTMLKSDVTRNVGLWFGSLTMQQVYDDIERRARTLSSLANVKQNDIVIVDEFMIETSGRSRIETRNEYARLEELITIIRHKRIVVIVIDGYGRFGKSADIHVTAIDRGTAVVNVEYGHFLSYGIVHFDRSPFDIDHEVTTELASLGIERRFVVVCSHCLGIIDATSDICPYCGSKFTKKW